MFIKYHDYASAAMLVIDQRCHIDTFLHIKQHLLKSRGIGHSGNPFAVTDVMLLYPTYHRRISREKAANNIYIRENKVAASI